MGQSANVERTDEQGQNQNDYRHFHHPDQNIHLAVETLPEIVADAPGVGHLMVEQNALAGLIVQITKERDRG
jgi:hypothetical protein